VPLRGRLRDAASPRRHRYLGYRALAGHESPKTTQIYLHADLALKEQALARTTPPDTVLAFLESL